MTKLELAEKILRELNYLPEHIKMLKDDRILCSEEPYGMCYDVDEEQKEIIQDLAEKGRFVYAVVHGAYRMCDNETERMTTYLFISNNLLQRAEANLLSGAPILTDILDEMEEDYGYRALALVEGPERETGDVGVKGRNGGLTRTC